MFLLRLKFVLKMNIMKKESNMKKITSVDLFAGVGGMRIALNKAIKKLGLIDECKLYSDLNSYCQKTYNANFPNTPLLEDIKTVKINEINKKIPDHDILCGGFPCQPFSNAGKRLGFQDNRQGNLFFAIKESALIKLLMFLQSPPEGGSTLPFSSNEASYVIGLTYRFTLSQTIMASLEIKPSAKAHEKVGALGWRDYYSKIVAPALKKRNIKETALMESGNLREREASLRNKANVKVVLTGNDFLLTGDDLAWFRERFPGKRTIFTETGGHMGQLWKPEIYNAMRAAIRFKKADFPAE